MKNTIQQHVQSKYFKSVSALILMSVLAQPTLALAENAAIALLNRMNQALHQLNYTGNLVLIQGNNVSSLQIDHTVVNGVQSERVVRLNEAGSEVSRELKGFSLASIPRIGPEMEKVYSFDLGRENRVANIPCRIITARPKDRERYLQKYCIDNASGMLLDYMLVGKSHKPVEQFMFTTIEIRMPETVAEVTNSGMCSNKANDCSSPTVTDNSEATTAILDQAITEVIPVQNNAVAKAQAGTMFRQVSNVALEDGWIMEALPAGYEISQAPHMKNATSSSDGNDNDKSTITKHYIVSDGLSSLSVFVSPLTDNIPAGAIKINSGALNVVAQEKGGQMITVVGEVPELTLRNIVKNLRKKN